MDIRKVKKLIEMLENSSLNEIVIKEGEESVKLVKSAGFNQAPQMVSASPQVIEQPVSEQKISDCMISCKIENHRSKVLAIHLVMRDIP